MRDAALADERKAGTNAEVEAAVAALRHVIAAREADVRAQAQGAQPPGADCRGPPRSSWGWRVRGRRLDARRPVDSHHAPGRTVARGPYLQWAPEGAATVAWYQDVATPGSRVEWRPEGGSWTAVGRYRRRPPALRGGAGRAAALVPVRLPRPRGAGGPMPDAAGRTEFPFRTPRPEAVKLAFMGDTRSGEPRQYDAAARLATEDPPPDAITVVGDLIYPHGEDAGYDPQFFAPYRPLPSAIPFYGALGNHDYETSSGAPLFAVFTLPQNGPSTLAPESAYWVERAGVLTIVHNTNLPAATLRDVALPWHATIARCSAVFRLAVLHHPPFSSGPNAKDPPTPTIKALFPPALSASGTDLALPRPRALLRAHAAHRRRGVRPSPATAA